MEHQKVWLITGISKGLGKEIAKIAHQQGHQVVGLARKESDKNALENELEGSRIYILDLEECDKINVVLGAIIQDFDRIDVLVNNAGYGMFGLFEEVSLQELRRQFEVNVFAKWSLITAVLPTMRKQKSGTIVQISSRLGILAGIGNAAYSAAEFAIEGMSESLADEVRPFGINVVLAEPGPMRTSFFGSSITFAEKKIHEYNAFFGDLRANFKSKDGQQKGNPKAIAAIIVNAVGCENVPFRIPVTAITIEALQHKAEAYFRLCTEWNQIARSVDSL